MFYESPELCEVPMGPCEPWQPILNYRIVQKLLTQFLAFALVDFGWFVSRVGDKACSARSPLFLTVLCVGSWQFDDKGHYALREKLAESA